MARTPVDELTQRLDAYFSGRPCQPVVLANPALDRRRVEAAQAAAGADARLKGHVLVATSGTTAAAPGEDKWVALSRQAILASANAVNGFLESGPHDVWLNPLPKYHVGGLGIWIRARLSGAACVPLLSWTPDAFVAAAVETRATLASLVPTQVFDLVSAGLAAPRTLRAVVVGGGSLDASVKSHALELGWPLLESYGMSETASQIATARTPEERTLTPLPHATIAVEADGTLVVVESSALLTAYVFVSEETSRIEDPKVAGSFRTQDLAEASDEGKIRILGRRSSFVKILGENVDLGRLSALARRVATEAGARDAAVTSVPDPRAGARVALAIEGPAAIAAACLERFNTLVLPYERAIRVVPLPEIPRTALGKVAEVRLAEEVSRLDAVPTVD